MKFDSDDFWSRVDIKSEAECWEWLGCRLSLGYGQYTVSRKHFRANRVALALQGGNMPPSSVYACHSCDNPACCNPSHLFWGSPQDNVTDMIAKGRCKAGSKQAAVTHCPQGHPYDELNTYVSRRGSRTCRKCARARTQEWKARQRLVLSALDDAVDAEVVR